MATTYVRSRIHLQALVSVQHVQNSTPGSEAPLEDRYQQWVQKHDCIANYIDYNDWRWRWETAIQILCAGYADTHGYYYGDVIGGHFV